MRLTKQRRAIINVLKESKVPLNAETIFNNLDLQLDLSTVYRTLDRLFEENLVTKNYFNNIAHYMFNDGSKHKHFIYCIECRKVSPIDCHFEEWIDSQKLKDVTVLDHDITLYGYCKKCGEKLKTK